MRHHQKENKTGHFCHNLSAVTCFLHTKKDIVMVEGCRKRQQNGNGTDTLHIETKKAGTSQLGEKAAEGA